jgi:hypothetical protein
MAESDIDLDEKQNKEMEEYCLNLFAELERERRFIEPMWKEISDYLLPKYSGWDFVEEADVTAGQKIFDGAPQDALSRLKDGIVGWLVSPTIPWLEFAPAEAADADDHEFMKYLAKLKMYMYDVFNRSNFYDAISEDIGTCAGIGTSVITVEEAEELGRPIYIPLHPREVYIAENRYREVDILIRKYQITARQLMEEFGDNYTDKEKSEILKGRQQMVTMLHCVFPNKDYEDTEGAKLGDKKKIRSVHLVYKGPKPKMAKTSVLRVSGMDQQKFQAWRFMRGPGMVYGASYAMDAIYQIKMINMQAKTMIDADQLAARPPVQTSELMKGKLRILPGGVTYGYDPVTPIFTGQMAQRGIDAMDRSERIIKGMMKTDFFMSISQLQQSSRDRTATEIMEIKAESAAVLGSVVGRIQSERLEPLVLMTMYIEKEAGRLPIPPEGIDPNKVFTLQFVGPLAQSQKKYLRVQGITQGLGAAMQVAQQAPDTLMNFDMNWAVRELAIANGYPHEGLNTLQETQKMQQQAQEARAAQQKAQMENERLIAMGNGAKAPEPGSAAGMMMGGQ